LKAPHFTKREKEVMGLLQEGVKDYKIIAANLGMKDEHQVAVHLSNAKKRVFLVKKFLRTEVKQFKSVLFAEKEYKE